MEGAFVHTMLGTWGLLPLSRSENRIRAAPRGVTDILKISSGSAERWNGSRNISWAGGENDIRGIGETYPSRGSHDHELRTEEGGIRERVPERDQIPFL